MDPTGARSADVKALQPNTSLRWARSTAPMLRTQLDPGRHVLACAMTAHEKPAIPAVDAAKYQSSELWAQVDALLGERIERPAFR